MGVEDTVVDFRRTLTPGHLAEVPEYGVYFVYLVCEVCSYFATRAVYKAGSPEEVHKPLAVGLRHFDGPRLHSELGCWQNDQMHHLGGSSEHLYEHCTFHRR